MILEEARKIEAKRRQEEAARQRQAAPGETGASAALNLRPRIESTGSAKALRCAPQSMHSCAAQTASAPPLLP